jgi:hypothetical protein
VTEAELHGVGPQGQKQQFVYVRIVSDLSLSKRQCVDSVSVPQSVSL